MWGAYCRNVSNGGVTKTGVVSFTSNGWISLHASSAPSAEMLRKRQYHVPFSSFLWGLNIHHAVSGVSKFLLRERENCSLAPVFMVCGTMRGEGFR